MSLYSTGLRLAQNIFSAIISRSIFSYSQISTVCNVFATFFADLKKKSADWPYSDFLGHPLVVQVEGYQHGSNFLIIINHYNHYVEHQLLKFINLVLCLHTVAETFNDGAKKENYSYNYFCKNEAVLSDIHDVKFSWTFYAYISTPSPFNTKSFLEGTHKEGGRD